MGASSSKRKQKPLPGEAEPDTWPHGIRALRTVEEICIIVEELCDKRRLKRAGALHDKVDEIEEMVGGWADKDIGQLRGVQVAKMATAVEIFETELKRVYNKVLNHLNKRALVVSGLRLTGSLARALEKVKHDLIVFESSMQSILRDAEALQTRPRAVAPIGTQYSDEEASESGGDGEFEPEDDDASEGGSVETDSESGEEGAVKPLGATIISSDSSDKDGVESQMSGESATGRRGGSGIPRKGRGGSRKASGKGSRRQSIIEAERRSRDESVAGAVDDRPAVEKQPSLDDDDGEDEEPIERQETGADDGVVDGGRNADADQQPVAPALGAGSSSLWERYTHDDAALDSSADSFLESPTAEFPLSVDTTRPSRWAKYMPSKSANRLRRSTDNSSAGQRELRGLIARADAGDPESALQAGFLCREGQMIDYEPVATLEYFRIAAEAGNAEACFMVGSMVAVGEGLAAPDYEEAAAWYRRAACQGHIESAASFGQALEGGIGVRENLGAAAAWYKKAAMDGSSRGANSLGKLYFDGRGVQQDFKKAAAWFRYAAQCAAPVCAAALNNLGICYEDGMGVECQPEVAGECYQRAADLGHLGALLNLAYLKFGRGEFSSARMHFELAASKGNADAIYSLACILERQALTAEASVPAHVEQEQDVRKQGGHDLWGSSGTTARTAAAAAAENAELLFFKAAQAGDPRAQHRLASFYWDEGLIDEALSLFHNAAAQHHAPSLNALGIIAEEGQGGCAQDLQAAWECYRLAAHYGSVEAEKNLRAVDALLDSTGFGGDLRRTTAAPHAFATNPATPSHDWPQEQSSSTGYSISLSQIHPDKSLNVSSASEGAAGASSTGKGKTPPLVPNPLPGESPVPPSSKIRARHDYGNIGPRVSSPVPAIDYGSRKAYTIPVRIDYTGLSGSVEYN